MVSRRLRKQEIISLSKNIMKMWINRLFYSHDNVLNYPLRMPSNNISVLLIVTPINKNNRLHYSCFKIDCNQLFRVCILCIKNGVCVHCTREQDSWLPVTGVTHRPWARIVKRKPANTKILFISPPAHERKVTVARPRRW